MTERDWEAAAAARLQRTIANLVSRMRDTADRIEQEAKHNIAAATKGDGQFSTYARAAGTAIDELHTLAFNAKPSIIIDAAADADAAHAEKQATSAAEAGDEQSKDYGRLHALSTFLGVLDGWIDGSKSNHGACDHRGEGVGEECWRSYAPADIRRMVNDAAREVGVKEWPEPEVAAEDVPLDRS